MPRQGYPASGSRYGAHPGVAGYPVAGSRYGSHPDGAPASANTPLTVYGASLAQWMRGDLGITTATGVTAWADQSGLANDYTQLTGGSQPVYTANDATLDNQPTVTADGANDVLNCTTLTVDLAVSDLYICAIVKPITWTSGDTLTGGNGTTPPRSFQSGVTPAINQTATASANSNTGGVVGTWVRYESLWSTTAGLSYLKIGSTVASGGNPGTGTRTSSSLFGAPAALFGNYALAEFFVVITAAGSGGPNGSQRTTIDTYLAGRYPSASF